MTTDEVLLGVGLIVASAPGTAGRIPAGARSVIRGDAWDPVTYEHYDVIIIGHRRRRRHAGPHAGRVRQADPAARTGRLPAPRDGQLGSRRRCSSTGKYISPDTWYDADGKPFQPQVHYFVGGATKLYGAALYRLRPAGLRRAQARRRHLAGLAADLRRLRAVVHARPSGSTRCTATTARIPTEGHWSKQYPWPAVSHEPRIQEISDDLAGAGYHPFHAPCGILLDEADRPRSTCIRCTWCDGYPCLVHAKSDADVDRGAPDPRPAERDAAGRRRGPAPRDRPGAAAPSPASWSTATGSRRCTRPTSWWSSAGRREQRQASCSARRPTGTRTAWPTARTRSAATTCSTTARPSSRWRKERNDTVFQKTLGLNDFYFAGDGHEWPLGNIQMVGKSNAEAMKGEEPKLTMLAPHWSLADVARHAVDFWLTTEDLPMPDNRVTLDRDGSVHLAYAPTNDDEADRALPRAQEDPQPRRDGRAPRARQELLHEHEHPRSPAAPTRPAPAGSATTRRRRCSTSTARPTSSTTSTSSTPASSPASAR